MATKLPELAVILSVIVLGRRFSESGNHRLAYLLLDIGVIGGIWWIHSVYRHYTKKDRVPKSVGKLRFDLTWATASVLVTFVIYPWIHAPIHEAGQIVAVPATPVEPSTPPSPVLALTQPKEVAKLNPSAPTIQPPGPAGPSGLTGLGNYNTLVNPPPMATGNTIIRPTDSRRNTSIGPDQITLFFSQTGNTVTVKPSGRIDSPSIAFFFDVDVSLLSTLGTCISCGSGRLKDSNGVPDNKTIWIFWASPFIPDDPLSITFSSATPAKLLQVTRGPRPEA